MTENTLAYLPGFTSRKANLAPDRALDDLPDSLAAWMDRYLIFAVKGVRSKAVARKIALHLARFIVFFQDGYGHDRLSTCLRRDVLAWQTVLQEQGLAPATIKWGMTRWLSHQRLRQPKVKVTDQWDLLSPPCTSTITLIALLYSNIEESHAWRRFHRAWRRLRGPRNIYICA